MRDRNDNVPRTAKDQTRDKKQAVRRGKPASPPLDNQPCVPLAGTSKRAKFSKADQQNNNFTTPVKNDNRRYPVRNRRNSEGSQQQQQQRTTQGKQTSPQVQQQNGTRHHQRKSPSQSPSPSTIPATCISPATAQARGIAYAGAKFSDPPSPKVLPKPPTHWVNVNKENAGPSSNDITNVLRVMLKVQS